MRKLLITFLFIMVMFSTISAGAVTIYYNDAYHDYTADGIRLQVNGNPVQGLHMPPLIMNDKTIVPVREVFVALGATVTWNEEECMTEIRYKGNTVKFKIGDRKTHVNGKVVPISEDQPLPMLIGYVPDYMKTMVPVRFIAQHLGLKVEWNDAERIVNVIGNTTAGNGNVSTDKLGSFGYVSAQSDAKYDYIYIETKYGISPTVSRYKNPDRIAFDFKGAQFPGTGGTVKLDGNCVNTVRYANHDSMARVVLDLKASAQPVILSSDRGILIRTENSENTQIIYDAFSKRVYFTGKYKGSVKNSNGVCSVTFSDLKMNEQRISIQDNNIRDIVIQPSGKGCRVSVEGNANIAYSDSQGFYVSAEVNVPTAPVAPVVPPEAEADKSDGVKTVIIDAGHGGSDPGAVGYNVNGQAVAYESHINLAVATLVRDKLQNAGVKVIMTRSEDVRVTLQERTDLENEIVPDCFVSIHCNAIEKANVAGTQVYFHPESPTGTILANNIYNSVVDITGLAPKKTQNGENLFVIRKTTSPAALVEMAFISNASDREYLMSSYGQDALATAITQGIIKSLNEF